MVGACAPAVVVVGILCVCAPRDPQKNKTAPPDDSSNYDAPKLSTQRNERRRTGEIAKPARPDYAHTRLLSQRLAEVLITSNITPKKTRMATTILANPAIRTDFAAMFAISMNALRPVSPRMSLFTGSGEWFGVLILVALLNLGLWMW
jgi:hypothetical protein